MRRFLLRMRFCMVCSSSMLLAYRFCFILSQMSWGFLLSYVRLVRGHSNDRFRALSLLCAKDIEFDKYDCVGTHERNLSTVVCFQVSSVHRIFVCVARLRFSWRLKIQGVVFWVVTPFAVSHPRRPRHEFICSFLSNSGLLCILQ